MNFSLKGKTALVTGSTGLIGKKHCEALAHHGARVIAADRVGMGAEDFGTSLGEGSFGISFDISSKNEVLSALDLLRNKVGSLDILVNNAAINEHFDADSALEQSKLENFSYDIFDRMLRVNVGGLFLCCQAFGSDMAKKGSGSIINIASTYGIVAPDQNLYKDALGNQKFFKSPAYPTSKAAVIGLTRYLASYWGKSGVRVNSLSPGGVENGQDDFFRENYSLRTPLGRMARAEDYQGALVFLSSDASSYMTGANLVVDGGWTVW